MTGTFDCFIELVDNGDDFPFEVVINGSNMRAYYTFTPACNRLKHALDDFMYEVVEGGGV